MLSCETEINHPLYVEGDGVFDLEGNAYKTVVIGNQEWMAENLKTDLYCNGDSIQYTGADVRVKVYDNDLENEAVFGKLYNYQAVLDTSGLCPCDWHVPTELEYAILLNYLGGYLNAYPDLKSKGNLNDGDGLWAYNEQPKKYDGTNLSGFNALPAGYGYYDTFDRKDSTTSFWTSSSVDGDAIEIRISEGLPQVQRIINSTLISKKVYYYSVRCIKNL